MSLQKAAAVATVIIAGVAVLSYLQSSVYTQDSNATAVAQSGVAIAYGAGANANSSSNVVVNNSTTIIDGRAAVGENGTIVTSTQPNQSFSVLPNGGSQEVVTIDNVPKCFKGDLASRFKVAQNISSEISRDMAVRDLTNEAINENNFGCAFSFTKHLTSKISKDLLFRVIAEKMIAGGYVEEVVVVISQITSAISRDLLLRELLDKKQ